MPIGKAALDGRTTLAADEFATFGPAHVVTLGVFVAVAVLLIAVTRGRRGTAEVPLFSKVFAVLVPLATIPMQVYQVLPGELDVQKSLPFQLCDFAWIAATVALWTHRPLPVALTYYWGITLTTQGMITPDLGSTFPDLSYLMFWAMHMLIVWSALYLTFGRGIALSWREYRITVLVTFVWAVAAFVFNVVTGANYGYLNRKPDRASALDLLGPWPAYVVLEILLILAVWALMTWPWVARARRSADVLGRVSDAYARSAMSETALITGATSGIGAEFARQLAAGGYDLVLVARDVDRLQRTCERLSDEHGVDVSYLRADLTEREDVDTVAQRLADPSGPVDVLVNNAGYGLVTKFADSTIDDEQRNLEILVGTPMRLSHAAMGPMLERRHGRIINIASVAGYTPRGTYGAHKAWLISFSRWANLYYAANGVTTTAVCAGFVRTEFHQRMDSRTDDIPGWMWLRADRLVREALADAEAGKAISTPSKRYKVLATAARFAPQGFVAKVARKGREPKDGR